MLWVKSSANGLSMRFLRLMIRIMQCAPYSSIGKALSEGFLPGNVSENSGITVRKRPLAASLPRTMADSITIVALGGGRPHARKASWMIAPTALPSAGSTQGSFTSSSSLILRRRAQGLCAPPTTTTLSSNKSRTEVCSSATASVERVMTSSTFRSINLRTRVAAGPVAT